MDRYRELILTLVKGWTEHANEEKRYETRFLAEAIKGMATHLKDVEVIGYATLLEDKSNELIQQEDAAWNYMDTYHDDFIERNEDIRKLCIKVFYKDEQFKPNMSKYRAILEENKGPLTKTNRYEKLSRYIDEKQVLDKIYNKIKGDLQTTFSGDDSQKMPDEEYIKEAYPDYLTEIYRLANNHVKSEVEKSVYELGK